MNENEEQIKKLLREGLDKTITCKNVIGLGKSLNHLKDLYICHKCYFDNTQNHQ
jgi:hypothetical protein